MKKFLLILLVLAGVFIWFFLNRRQVHPSGYWVQIYFPDKNNLFLVPITRALPSVTPQAVLNELKKGPVDSNHLLASFSPKESPVEVKANGKTLTVNFSVAPSLERWPLIIQSFLATFKQFHEYTDLEFLIQGEEAVILNGEEIGKESLPAFAVNENTSAAAPECPDSGCTRVVIFRHLNGTGYLVPITQNVSDKISLENAVSQALSTKPKLAWALSSALSPGCEIRAVKRTSANEIELTADLKGTDAEKKLAQKAILLSFAEIPGVTTVRCRCGGWFPVTFAKAPFGLSINTETP